VPFMGMGSDENTTLPAYFWASGPAHAPGSTGLRISGFEKQLPTKAHAAIEANAAFIGIDFRLLLLLLQSKAVRDVEGFMGYSYALAAETI